MMMGKPMKVTRDSCHERLNMKTTTPVTFTVFRRKMLMFWETRSLTMVVSEVRREMRSPGTRAAQLLLGGGHLGTPEGREQLGVQVTAATVHSRTPTSL